MDLNVVHNAMLKRASEQLDKRAGIFDDIGSGLRRLFGGKKKVPQIDMGAIRNNSFIKNKAPGVADLTQAEMKNGLGNDIVAQAKRIGDTDADIQKFLNKRDDDLFSGYYTSNFREPKQTDIGRWNRENRSLLPRLHSYENTINDMYHNERNLQDAIMAGKTRRMKVDPSVKADASIFAPQKKAPEAFRSTVPGSAEAFEAADRQATNYQRTANKWHIDQYNKDLAAAGLSPLADAKETSLLTPIQKDKLLAATAKRDKAMEAVRNQAVEMALSPGKRIDPAALLRSGALKYFPKK